jgi:hypothetical protein
MLRELEKNDIMMIEDTENPGVLKDSMQKMAKL